MPNVVCPYVHIKIGNVKEQSLAEISKKGLALSILEIIAQSV